MNGNLIYLDGMSVLDYLKNLKVNMNNLQKPLKEMSISERLYIANNIYVVYPRFKEILASIDDCHHLSNLKDEPECLFLKGETGAGKTTILKSYTQNYPRSQTADGTIIPILEVTIPSPATVKSVVTKLLWELGDPER